MALPSTIYRAVIQLANIDHNLYLPLQVTIAQHPSETAERLVTRLLAYALFYEPELAFTKGVGAGDEPDLWVIGPDGRVLTWIEVGLPDPERLIKAGRHCQRVLLLASGSTVNRWLEQHRTKFATIVNLSVYSIDQRFLAQVASRLQRTISWSLTITENQLYLEINGDTLEGALTLQTETFSG
jgi:uncharacterized protein YaeQ